MLQTSYILLFVVLFGIILTYYNTTMKRLNIDKKVRLKIIVFVLSISILWLSYIAIITNSQILLDRSLPPKIPLLIIAPLFLFTGIFLYRNRHSRILHTIPFYLPIAYQSFRAVIEILFYFSYLKGWYPIEVTFEGSNYDILLGLSAPIIALYAYKKADSEKSFKCLIYWNIIGLIVVGNAAFTFITTFYFPSVWGANESLMSNEFLTFPLLLLPAFFMPSAIFMHILSIIQLRKKCFSK